MGFFTSGLTVNEFALLGRLGPRPLAQVMGASVIQTGWQYLPPLDPGRVDASFYTPYVGRGAAYASTLSARALQNRYTDASPSQVRNYKWHAEVVCSLDVLTDAWNSARRLALDRIREEAVQVGADAVVGVHVRRSDRDLGRGTIEYVISGTAIRLPGSSGTPRPTLTNVSVQDYWRLHTMGHEPVAFIATTAVTFASAARGTRLQRLRTTTQNQELAEVTKAFQDARERVRAALRDQVREAHGTGAVGVELSHSVEHEKLALASSIQTSDRRGWHLGRLGVPYRVSGRDDVKRAGWVITMHAAGTAIRRGRDPAGARAKAAIRMGS
jgi:uncharacterized protein YbjQ (UPF0145 family)